ncbi:MAG: hypothetical protein IPO93_13855 [Actinobacteria bacterium]|nr:hypothetical protein [Actinomycetota bacterium]
MEASKDDALLERLDLVVASVYSMQRMPNEALTRRMVVAIAKPHVDILATAPVGWWRDAR